MKYPVHILLSAVVIMMLAGCSSISVVSDYNHDTDFSAFKTFNFKKAGEAPEKYPVIINELNQKRIEKFINDEMSLRNYKLSGTPDLWISYYVKIEDKTRYETTTYNADPWHRSYYGPYYYGYYYGYGHSWTNVQEVNYKVGTLIVDIVDAAKNELVWYGAASKVLENNRDPERTIDEAVTKMFYKYPFMAGEAKHVK